MSRWKQIWEARALPASADSDLAKLLAADGFDTGFGTLDERCWSEFVARRADDLGLAPGCSVFEVGCGAGAFLYELRRRGCRVAGVDWSDSLIGIARSVMPDGAFDVVEAVEMATEPPVDAVVACSVFAYFPSVEYGGRVLERMVARATCAVGILDVPDADRREAALAYRMESAGAESYEERYAGLDHCYYDRSWMVEALRRAGLVDVRTADQDLEDYGNASFRFNVWGFKPDAG